MVSSTLRYIVNIYIYIERERVYIHYILQPDRNILKYKGY